MRLPAHDWLQAPHTLKLQEAFGDVPLRFVGGCVRDALLGRPVGDIDCATPALPEATLALLAAAGIKAVPTGLAHGTVTAVVDGKPFEITTLRRDVSCDGRRATVAFSDDWQEDAARRDFTMNALYCDADGTLHDYHDGVADATAGYVRFIGDPAARIREDALRILRFFRFYASHGKGEPDAAALTACRALGEQLDTLSAERVQHELLKLLSAPDPRRALGAMHKAGVLGRILPESAALALYTPCPHPILRLALMLPETDQAHEAAQRLKLSNHDRDLLLLLVGHPFAGWPQEDLEMIGFARHLSVQTAALLLWRNAARLGIDEASCKAVIHHLETLAIPTFPLRGDDLIARGIPSGKAIGETLARLDQAWEQSGYRLSKDALLAML